MSITIGIDLGGTMIKGGVLRDIEVLDKHSIPTEGKGGPEHVMDRIASLARELAQRVNVPWDEVAGVGVGTPGPLDEHERVIMAPNLPGWTDVDLRGGLIKRLDCPVRVVNDANAAALGEFTSGAGRDPSIRHLVLLTLGTGVGGGVIVDGKLFVGAHGAGAEMGHSIIVVNGRPCAAGENGSIEAYCSATSIVKEAVRRITQENRPASWAEAARAGKLTTKILFEAMAAGDKEAESVIDEACMYLGASCVNMARYFDPQMIVLGGGVAAAGEALVSRVNKWFGKLTWHVRKERAMVTTAELGNDAGFIGAAVLARERL